MRMENKVEIVTGGEIGNVLRIEAALCFPLLALGDIRYRYDLGGGATMDAGCYAVSMVRHVAGAEPEVVSAEARLRSPNVDRYMQAELRFADGRTAQVTQSLLSSSLLRIRLHVQGDAGELSVFNPVMPHAYHRLRVRSPSGTRSERVPGEPTYTCQLRAFVGAVRDGRDVPTDARDAVANMQVIDAIYERAGLPLRGV